MHNFQINFNYPWFLLLLIPAVLLTLWPHFKLSKRHRRTRNRIVSIVLHLTVALLCILALCGMNFSYQVPNEENEILLLVDVSDSEEEAAEKRDEFINLVLQDGQYDGYKIGVVTFGYDQVYAVPFTYDVDEIYERYLAAELPDTTATNIASAFTYARGLFDDEHKQSAKIVLITDGKETDEEASLVIRSIAAEGIKVDAALIPSEYKGGDAQITSVELPEHHLTLGEEYAMTVNVQSQDSANVSIELFDNGELHQTAFAESVKGAQSVAVPFTFEEEGLHELLLKLTVSKGNDELSQNNVYYTYQYVEAFNKLLVLQREDGESDKFVSMINGSGKYDITVMTISETGVPATLTDFCQYDQVVLNNIANADMPRGFVEILYSYVNECGGGLFTIGGDREEDGKSVANAYNRKDMYNTLYQQMLPVEAINYTPPLGVMVLMDTSGSMKSAGDGTSGTKLDWAKAGVDACLDALNVRDYIGVLTFDDYADPILELTPRTQEAKIKQALNEIKNREDAGGGTVVSGSLEAAGQALAAQKDISKRHIVIVTDGVIANVETVIQQAKNLYDTHGITVSVVGISVTDKSTKEDMQALVDAAHGRLIIENPGDNLVAAMREELNVQPLKEVEEVTFNPEIYDAMSPLVKDLDRMLLPDGTEDRKKLSVTLDGFYGVRARATAELILIGDYEVPIYAQWRYGKGMVGSFMCDLQGIRSSAFMADENGVKFIQNAINNLMPMENIRPNDIKVELNEDNYTNSLSVYLGTPLQEGETLKGEIYNAMGELVLDLNSVTESEEYSSLSYYVTSSMNKLNKYSRADFVLKESGVYKIVVTKYNAAGEELGKAETYKALAYSKEYDSFAKGPTEELSAEDFVEDVAERGNGKVIADLENPYEIFEGFVTDLDKNFDPRMIFLIAAIVLFLLDIAVRKFKFKWPHEIIKAIKEKRDSK